MTFSHNVKEDICVAQNGFCKYEGCYEPIHSIHHMFPQTKYNIKKYPTYIHSIFNGVGLCEKHHRDNAHEFKVDEQHAKVYEYYLNI